VDVTEETWLTTGEAARIANRDPRTVRTWADSGILRCRWSPGGHRQIALSSLLSAQQPHRRPTNTRTPTISPDEALPQWTTTGAGWCGWEPGRHATTTELESLLKDTRDLADYISEIEHAVQVELHRRDEADQDQQPAWLTIRPGQQ
jgi:hypothetical protein